MSQRFLSALILILCTGYVHNARAEGGGSQFGVVYGQSVPDSDNTNPRRLFGVKGAAYLAPIFSMGGYVFSSEEDEGTGGAYFKYSLHGLEGAFHIPTGGGDTFIATRIGLSKIRTDVVGADAIFSPYHYGVASGYDYTLWPWMSVGFEGSFMHVEKSTTLKSGTHYELPGFSIINFLLSVQFKL